MSKILLTASFSRDAMESDDFMKHSYKKLINKIIDKMTRKEIERTFNIISVDPKSEEIYLLQETTDIGHLIKNDLFWVSIHINIAEQ